MEVTDFRAEIKRGGLENTPKFLRAIVEAASKASADRGKTMDRFPQVSPKSDTITLLREGKEKVRHFEDARNPLEFACVDPSP